MGAKIMLVDDDAAWLMVISHRLRELGYQVMTACSALHAVRLAEKEQPALALLDVVMPATNGVELCYLLKHNHRLSDQLKVVMLSSITDLKVIEDARRAGASGYVLKSANLDEVVQQVVSLLMTNPAANMPNQAVLSVRCKQRKGETNLHAQGSLLPHRTTLPHCRQSRYRFHLHCQLDFGGRYW